MRISFFGTPDFAAHSLHILVKSGYRDILVITAPDKQAGRGLKLNQSEVKKVALELGLPLLQPEKLKSPEFLKALADFNPDLGIVIAFRMLPLQVWSLPKLGTFNLHASLLPHYRGAAPIHHAVINGEKESGVTTFFLKHEIDTGDIMLQKRVAIGRKENTGSLYKRMMIEGAELVIDTLKLVEQGITTGQPQPEMEGLKPAPKLSREFCELVDRKHAEKVYNKIRGLSPYPGAWLKSASGKVFKLLETEEPITKSSGKSNLYVKGKEVWLGCEDGEMRVLQLQPEGKKAMSDADFLNGLRMMEGELL